MSSPLAAVLLQWVVPPVVGAAIGWITNDIAIRMLFRPLREVRVLGVRLPFTPGIIPKERRSLAVSIGRMVSRELITEETLRRQVHEPRTLAALAGSVSSFTAGLLGQPVGRPRRRREGAPAVPAGGAARRAARPGGRFPRVHRHRARPRRPRGVRPRRHEGFRGGGALRPGALPRRTAAPQSHRRGAAAGGALADLVAEGGVGLLTDEVIAAAVRLAEPLLPGRGGAAGVVGTITRDPCGHKEAGLDPAKPPETWSEV